LKADPEAGNLIQGGDCVLDRGGKGDAKASVWGGGGEETSIGWADEFRYLRVLQSAARGVWKTRGSIELGGRLSKGGRGAEGRNEHQ